MCLIAKMNWFRKLFNMKPKVRTAKKDINVYKVLDKDVRSLISPCYGYRWYWRKLEQSRIIIEKSKRNIYYVNVGFHSFTIPTYGMFSPLYYTLYNAVIPKGSHYIVGNCDDIVSDQLIIIGKYK